MTLSGGDIAVPAQTRLNVRQLVLLVIAMFVAMMVLTLPVAQLDRFVSRLLPDGGADLALENTAKGFFQTAHFLAYIPFAFIWGALSDRSGKRKPILLIGMSGQAVMYFLIPFIDNIWLLYAVRFIEGTFGIAVVSMLMTMALDIAPPARRGMTLGIFTMGMLLGNAAGTPLGGSLSKLDLAYPFWLGTVLLAVISTIIFFLVKEPGAQTRAYSFRRALAAFREQPRLIIPYAFSFLDRLTVGFFISTFLLLVKEVYSLDAAQAGAYLGIFLGCFALFSPLGGILSDRLGRAKPMLLGTAIYGVTLLLIGRVAPEMLYAVMAIGGLSGAILYPPSIALVGDYASPGQRGVAMGGFNLAGSTGFAIGPILFGLIADAYGLLATPLVAGALCLLAAAVAAPILLRKEGVDTVSPELQT
ncbi:MAG TPA: MFS transporter [Chloroflexia bacterium]|nr:MFS transporter [Chloroflexia bacterium]